MIEHTQQLHLGPHKRLAGGAGHRQGTCPHPQILAQWLGMALQIKHSHGPEDAIQHKVLATEVEKWHTIAHGSLHVSNQRQDVRNGHCIGARSVDAAAPETTRPFDHPQMFAQFPLPEIDMKLLCPEEEQLVETIDALVRIAIVPAIDQTHDLRTPCPMASRMHLGIHRVLYSVEIVHLVVQRLVIDTADVGIERAKQNRDVRKQRMNGTLAEIKEPREEQRCDIDGSSSRLHLLIAALYCIGPALCYIIERLWIKEGLVY